MFILKDPFFLHFCQLFNNQTWGLHPETCFYILTLLALYLRNWWNKQMFRHVHLCNIIIIFKLRTNNACISNSQRTAKLNGRFGFLLTWIRPNANDVTAVQCGEVLRGVEQILAFLGRRCVGKRVAPVVVRVVRIVAVLDVDRHVNAVQRLDDGHDGGAVVGHVDAMVAKVGSAEQVLARFRGDQIGCKTRTGVSSRHVTRGRARANE